MLELLETIGQTKAGWRIQRWICPFFEIRMLRRNVLETLWLHLTAIFLSPSFHIPCIWEVMLAKAKLSHQEMISSFQHFLPSSCRLATVAWIWILCRLLIHLRFMPLIHEYANPSLVAAQSPTFFSIAVLRASNTTGLSPCLLTCGVKYGMTGNDFPAYFPVQWCPLIND